jgi:hypothetical protein
MVRRRNNSPPHLVAFSNLPLSCQDSGISGLAKTEISKWLEDEMAKKQEGEIAKEFATSPLRFFKFIVVLPGFGDFWIGEM